MAQKIVVIGGGHGTAALAGPLVQNHHDVDLTAIVHGFDSGGDSDRWRRIFRLLAVGDARIVMTAMAQNRELADLFEYRHKRKKGFPLPNSPVGNFAIVSLVRKHRGRVDLAIEAACRLLQTRGTVLPVSLDYAHLNTSLDDGYIVRGEKKIDTRPATDPRHIVRAWLTPEVTAYPPVIEAIMCANKVVLGAGDLWTSLIPNLLVPKVADALRHTKAKVIYAVNIMTKQNETDGYEADRFVEVVCQHIERRVNIVVCNSNRSIPEDAMIRYSGAGSEPVRIDPQVKKRLEKFTDEVIVEDLVQIDKKLIRHSPALAELVAYL